MSEDSNIQVMIAAIREGKPQVVSSLLARHPDLANEVGPDGLTPLDEACMLANESIVKVLMDAGANVNYVVGSKSVYKGYTPLHFAADAPTGIGCVKLLFEAPEIRPMEKEALGRTPFHLTALRGSVMTAMYLFNKGLATSECDQQGRTPLMLAASKVRPSMCSYMTDIQPEVINVADIHGNTALHHAFHAQNQPPFNHCYPVRMENYDVAVTLINCGINVDLRNKEGDTAFDYIHMDFADTLEFYARRIDKIGKLESFDDVVALVDQDLHAFTTDEDDYKMAQELFERVRQTKAEVEARLKRLCGCPFVDTKSTPPIRKFKAKYLAEQQKLEEEIDDLAPNDDDDDAAAAADDPLSKCPMGFTADDYKGREDELPDFVKEKIKSREAKEKKAAARKAKTTANGNGVHANGHSNGEVAKTTSGGKCPVPFHKELSLLLFILKKPAVTAVVSSLLTLSVSYFVFSRAR